MYVLCADSITKQTATMLKLKRQELSSEADVVLPSHMTSQVLLSPTVLMCFVQ